MATATRAIVVHAGHRQTTSMRTTGAIRRRLALVERVMSRDRDRSCTAVLLYSRAVQQRP